MKKIIGLFVCLCLILCSATAFAGEDETITVTVDGEKLAFDVEPFIENDRTLVPMRGIFEALGCYVDYYSENGEEYVTAIRADDFVRLEIGKPQIVVNNLDIALDVAPKIVNDRTFVPVRAVSEALKENVDWNEATNTVVINKSHGDHKIVTKKIVDSTDKYDLCIYYPYIENKEQNDYVDSINAETEANAKATAKEEQANLMKCTEDLPEHFGKLCYCETFKVDRDSQDIYSVTSYIYVNLGGAHPNYQHKSQNYDLGKKEPITLAQALNMNENDVEKFVYESFKSYYADDNIFDDYIEPELKKYAKNVSFRITDWSVKMYFNPYEIAPYAYGMPSVEIVTIDEDKKSVVRPIKEEYSTDATYNAVINGINGDQITAKVYTPALYDAVEISQLKAGDLIQGSNGIIKIETIEQQKDLLVINGGLESMGIDLISNGGGTYAEAMWDDDREMTFLGEHTYRLADDVVLEDTSDIVSNKKVELNGKDDVIKYLSKGEIYGTVSIYFENEVIKEIKIIYHP